MRQLSSDLKLEALGMLSRESHGAQLAGCVGETEIGEGGRICKVSEEKGLLKPAQGSP